MEEKQNDFDLWSELKKKLHKKNKKIFFKEGDLIRTSIGKNIKNEILGKGENFMRPVIVFKKLSSDSCIVIPTSSKISEGSWFQKFKIRDREMVAVISQIRNINKNRFQKKIGTLDEKDFNEIKNKLKNLFNL